MKGMQHVEEFSVQIKFCEERVRRVHWNALFQANENETWQ